MARPLRLRAIARASLPGADGWVDPLLTQLNEALGQIGTSLGNGLTFGDNFQAEMKSISFVAPQDIWTSFSTYTNSWVNAGDASYRISPGGRVYARGTWSTGTIGLAATTIPAGYRPRVNERLVCDSNLGGTEMLGALIVTTAGVLTPIVGGNTLFSLSGLSWEAASPQAQVAISGQLAVVKHSLKKVSGVIPVKCSAETVATNAISGFPTLDWALNSDGSIGINSVSGLQAGIRYTMSLLVFAG